MNVKMLFFPLSITVALAVFVFYVKPEIDTTMGDRSALAVKESFATDVTKKIQNVQALESSLDTNKESEDAVLHYFPATRDDDRIVDGINFLVAQAGLSLASVKIEKVANLRESDVVVDAPVGSNVIFATASDIAAVTAAPIVPIVPSVLSAKVVAIGSYEGIRDAVAKLSHMDRFQDFASVDIARVVADSEQSSTDQPVTPSNTLSATFEMNFTYLPKVNVKGNFNRPILSQATFSSSFDVIQKLKQYTSTSVPSIEIGTTGAVNPFLR